MPKPRVLILENSIAVTGALKSVLRSSLYLSEWYDFVFVLPSKSEGIALVQQQGFQCVELPMKEIRKSFSSLLLYVPVLILNTIRFARLIRQTKTELIVSNDFYNLIPPLYSLFGGKAGYVCYVRFLPSKFPRTLVNIWFGAHGKFASTIIAVSEAVKRELPHQTKVVVVGNELPQMEDVKFIPSDSKLLLYPANYISGKGHQYALESFSRISQKFPDWKLRFVGGDMGLQKNKDYKELLIRKSEQLNLKDRIEWLGFVTNMDEQYMASSVVLNFSDSESFSLTCLEGMFYGRAVIATDCGGPSEIIDHDKTGLIVPVGDVEKMRQAIEFLLSNPARREELSAKGYTCIREKFSNHKITDTLHKIYDQGLSD